MSKLPKAHKFIDLSDFCRSVGRLIATNLKDTSVTPIQVTIWFFLSGIIAVLLLLSSQYWAAAFFIILKSILDAADGELSRLKNTPSYTGRYLDSIADIILNFLFIAAIAYISKASLLFAFIAFISLQLQGTIYNYYYVILRAKFEGDTTSRIFENKIPKALPGEEQKTVNLLFKIYRLLYGGFDKIIYFLDPKAAYSKPFPKCVYLVLILYFLKQKTVK